MVYYAWRNGTTDIVVFQYGGILNKLNNVAIKFDGNATDRVVLKAI